MTEHRTIHQWRDVPEHAIQSTLVFYLEKVGYAGLFFAIPNAAKRTPYTANRLMREGMTPGVADLCFMMSGGRVAWLEMKSKKGRQTPAQKDFERACLALGHPYAVAHSFDEALVILKQWKIIT